MLCHVKVRNAVDRHLAGCVARGLVRRYITRACSVFFSQQHPPLATGAQPPSENLVNGAGSQLAGMGAGAEIPACFMLSFGMPVKQWGALFRLLPGARCVLSSTGCTIFQRARK